ncbi:hypothetical protein F383_06484 [Gossypium arboreum]|uniref:Uncharacterized protein n=1 Tax=Gossypium arboreum TaxID=29729 RepID=A0A0B0P5K2_GOSAR|nr:hypothetical protein F383_06484 [Gossypium arboreum]
MGQKQSKQANMGNQHGLEFITRVDHTAVSNW